MVDFKKYIYSKQIKIFNLDILDFFIRKIKNIVFRSSENDLLQNISYLTPTCSAAALAIAVAAELDVAVPPAPLVAAI